MPLAGTRTQTAVQAKLVKLCAKNRQTNKQIVKKNINKTDLKKKKHFQKDPLHLVIKEL